MVNPVMGAKMEPLEAGSSHHHSSALGFVKLELEPPVDKEQGDDNNKVEVKMEVFNELFGDTFGGGILSESELVNPDSLSFAASSFASAATTTVTAADIAVDSGAGTTTLRTLKVPLHAEVGDGNFPPVLSIPASFAGITAAATSGGGLQISISPISAPLSQQQQQHVQGAADTTSLGSPPTTPISGAGGGGSASNNKKTVYTAKGTCQTRLSVFCTGPSKLTYV